MKRITLALFFGLIAAMGGLTAQVKEIVLPAAQKTGGMPLMEALAKRQSQRAFSPTELPLQDLSNLLWAANGVNRSDGHRTAPSAKGWNEFDIYVIKADGWYVYEPVQHVLLKMGNDDLREFAGGQSFVRTAPVNLVFVADHDRMTNADEATRIFHSGTDVGFISQNVYLYCASAGLATVVRGQIDKEKAREALKLRPAQHIILAQTVGYPAE